MQTVRNGNIIAIDENQHQKEYHYNWNGNMLWVKEHIDSANYYMTQYTYDQAGNVTSLTDARGNTTLYSYSLYGTTSIVYPDLTEETFSYDLAGNLIHKTDAHGTTVFTYNALYQVVNVLYPDSTSVSFTYDANGNRTSMIDSQGQTTCQYDSRNRPTSETRTIDGVPYTVKYEYDAASRLLSITYPDQSILTYVYDALGRLVSIPGYAEFTHDTESLLSTAMYANGVTTTYEYNSCHRPVSITVQNRDTDLLQMDYQYDPVGNVVQMDYGRLKENEWVQSQESFQYDPLHRLTSAQGNQGIATYTYDAAGNRLTQNNATYVYNNMNELLSTGEGVTFTYDESGNTSTKTEGGDIHSYVYDTRNNLLQVEKNQTVLATYEYDGDGRRVQKDEWVDSLGRSQTAVSVYSGSGVIYEKNTDTGKEAFYVYGPQGRIAKKVDGLRDYYHTDHLGSTRLITDESGNVVTDVSYTPFGEDMVTGEEDPHLYSGKEKDGTGLYYFGARYYNPETGRFLTRDPLPGDVLSPQSLNQYVYCLNNPLRYTDPTGMESVDDVHMEYVILPDGTVSYKLAELYNMLQDGLDRLSEEDWKEINDVLNNADAAPQDKLKAVEKVLLAAGIKPTWGDDGSLSVTFGSIAFTFAFTDLPSSISGAVTEGKNPQRRFILISNQLKNARDFFLVLGHELVHAAVLGYEGRSVASVEQRYGEVGADAFVELISYRWEYHMLGRVPGISQGLRDTVTRLYVEYTIQWHYIRTGGSCTIV